MIGVGVFPAGLAPAGFGGIVPVAGGKAVPLRDAAGDPRNARLIDPRTRQYVFGPDGNTLGMGGTRQRVLLAMSTVRGSSADPNLGHTLREIQDIGPDIERQIATRLRTALAQLVAEKAIQIVSITTELLPQQGTLNAKGQVTVLKWRDLTDPLRPVALDRV